MAGGPHFPYRIGDNTSLLFVAELNGMDRENAQDHLIQNDMTSIVARLMSLTSRW